jgi:glyoxylase I family protein
MLESIHHVAIICSDYARSKDFYVNKLGLKPLNEVFRAERQSYKLDLGIGNQYVIELFSFPSPPLRASYPEAAGLRHLCFGVADLPQAQAQLRAKGLAVEDIRVDPYTQKRFVFLNDPDGLPIELYEL